MKQMNREEFEAYIKRLSVDEMIEMMPEKIRIRDIEHFLQKKMFGNRDGETLYQLKYINHTGYGIRGVLDAEKNACCVDALLWLYDNNLLPGYGKDE